MMKKKWRMGTSHAIGGRKSPARCNYKCKHQPKACSGTLGKKAKVTRPGEQGVSCVDKLQSVVFVISFCFSFSGFSQLDSIRLEETKKTGKEKKVQTKKKEKAN